MPHQTTLFHHQKIVNLYTGEPVAIELLFRQHRELTLCDMLKEPKLFTQFMTDLVDAKRHYANAFWEKEPQQVVFLNFTPDQIVSPDFYWCVDALKETMAEDKRRTFAIEATENVQHVSWSEMVQRLSYARKAGMHIVVDDFGSGYSNFNPLIKLSPDTVKLDMQLIREAVCHDNARFAMYRLVEYLQSIGIKVVIEGIENEQERILARNSNAEFGQGNLFHQAAAFAADDIGELIAQGA